MHIVLLPLADRVQGPNDGLPQLVRDALDRSGREILNEEHGRDRSVEGLI